MTGLFAYQTKVTKLLSLVCTKFSVVCSNKVHEHAYPSSSSIIYTNCNCNELTVYIYILAYYVYVNFLHNFACIL